MSGALDVNLIRRDFPILSRQMRGKPLAYLDSAATSQKPLSVINAVSGYYGEFNANVHRGAYELSAEATEMYEGARGKIRRFIGAPEASDPAGVIYTRGTTEAVNLVMHSWGRSNVQAGDDIVVTRMEHHSNFVPWQQLALERGARLRIVELTTEGRLDPDSLKEALSGRPKLFAVTAMSNVLGTKNPVAELAVMAKEAGAVVFVDGAQLAAHGPVDIEAMGPIDFFTFSGHKVCGPTGIGVLWGRPELLEEMTPYQYGGDMIAQVEDERTVFNELPLKFEAGTPNIAGVVGLSAAVDYLEGIGRDGIRRYENELGAYALERLFEVPGLKLIGPRDMRDRGSVFSFEIDGVHPHDLATFLDVEGIAIRAGHHCAQPLMDKLGVAATARASFSFYNTREEADRLGEALKAARRYFT